MCTLWVHCYPPQFRQTRLSLSSLRCNVASFVFEAFARQGHDHPFQVEKSHGTDIYGNDASGTRSSVVWLSGCTRPRLPSAVGRAWTLLAACIPQDVKKNGN